MKDKLIWCNTKEKLEKVVQKLKSDEFNIPKTETMWGSYGAELVLSVHAEYKGVTYCSRDWYKEHDYRTPITADEFLGKSKNPAIVIFRRDRNVIAKNVATGDEGIAKCSPNDDFCFKTGASIALARLMAKTPEKGKPEAKFKVGDYVTLKEGLTGGKKYGALTLYSGRMYEYANGKRLEVESASFNESNGMYHYRCKAADRNYFYYTEAMLDKWDESKIHEGDTVKVINTGLSYTTYPQWVGEHISDPDMAARYCFESPFTDKKYKVLKIAEHESNGRMLAFIEEIDGLCYNSCYLIEVKGLVKV